MISRNDPLHAEYTQMGSVRYARIVQKLVQPVARQGFGWDM